MVGTMLLKEIMRTLEKGVSPKISVSPLRCLLDFYEEKNARRSSTRVSGRALG